MKNKYFSLATSENGKLSSKKYATFGSAFLALREVIDKYEDEGCLVYDNGEYARIIGDGLDMLCQIDEMGECEEVAA